MIFNVVVTLFPNQHILLHMKQKKIKFVGYSLLKIFFIIISVYIEKCSTPNGMVNSCTRYFTHLTKDNFSLFSTDNNSIMRCQKIWQYLRGEGEDVEFLKSTIHY